MELTRGQHLLFKRRIAGLFGEQWRTFSRREKEVIIQLALEDYLHSDEYRAFCAYMQIVAPRSRILQ